MKQYKTFDAFSQLVAILTALLGLFDNSGGVTSISLIAFALLQIVSLLVNAVYGLASWKSGLRRIHIIATVIVIGIMVYGLAKPAEDKYDYSGLGILLNALVPAAAVALFYTVITFIEWKKIRKA